MAKPGEAMRPKTATYVTHFDPNKLANPTAMSDAKCETFQIYIYIAHTTYPGIAGSVYSL